MAKSPGDYAHFGEKINHLGLNPSPSSRQEDLLQRTEEKQCFAKFLPASQARHDVIGTVEKDYSYGQFIYYTILTLDSQAILGGMSLTKLPFGHPINCLESSASTWMMEPCCFFHWINSTSGGGSLVVYWVVEPTHSKNVRVSQTNLSGVKCSKNISETTIKLRKTKILIG